MNHKKGYASAEAAARSKAAQQPGAVINERCPCGMVHVDRSRELAPAPRSPVRGESVPAPRARPGAMKAAVALVLAGQATVAQSAREYDVDPDRLESRAWAEAKRIVFERDHWTCQACGVLAQDIQHRFPRGMGGTSDPVIAFGRQNLIAMCRADHALTEARDAWMRERRFSLRSARDLALPILIGSEDGYRPMWLLADGTPVWEDPAQVAA